MSKTQKKQNTGAAFEENVLKILRLLGYSVQRNVTIGGCQIDMYAEYRTGVIRLRLMVECKDYRDPVGIEEVKEFSGAVFPALGKIIDKGLLVARSGFTRQAKDLAATAGIELADFESLANQLLDFEPYLDRLIQEFDSSPVASTYIDLSFAETEDYVIGDLEVIHRPLDDAVNRLLLDEKKSKVALLGNFGTGKTTWCRKYARDRALACKKESALRVPIVITLSDYDSQLDIQQLITNELQFRYGMRIDLTICQELQRLGRFLFLFDGFDEMAARVDPDVVRDNLREINKIARIPENVFVLTCRTHFFRDRVQAALLADFETLFIPEWGESELQEYLQKRFGNGWGRHLTRIHGTHNLAELAQTPLFLEMITQTLPALGEEVSRCKLYATYTDSWITEQSQRRGARLQSADRKTFVLSLATKLYRDDRLSCHYGEFSNIIQERFEVRDASQLDYLQSDARNCTFLTRNSQGYYEFRHKSFMEYFVAVAIAEQLAGGSEELLCLKRLPAEVRRFLVEILIEDPPRERLTTLFKSDPSAILKDNIFALLIDLRITLPQPKGSESQSEKRFATIVRYLQGDTTSFNEVVREYLPVVVKFLSRFGALPHDAQDIAYDVFIRVLEQKQAIESAEGFQRYLFVAARNRLFDQVRRQKRAELLVVPLDHFNEVKLLAVDSGLPPDEQLINKESEEKTRVSIERALAKLSKSERRIIEATVFDGFKLADVARELQMSPRSVSLLKREAIKRLKYILANS